MSTVALILIAVGVVGVVIGIVGMRRRTLPLLDELRREKETRDG